MKRRMVTLVEVLIAFSLLSLILFALLSSYSQLTLVDQAIGKEIEKGFEARHLESQLQATFLQILPVQEGKTFLYTDHPPFSGSPSLVFSYDAGVLLDPRFSKEVLGRLFVDAEGRLVLATWPSPLRYKEMPIPMRTTHLASGIRKIQFSFFVPPGGEIGIEPEPNQWHTDWKQSFKKVPPLIKVRLIKESLETVDFSFYLPNNQYPLKL